MLSTITFSYKDFVNAEMTCGPINVLVGGNNTGKTAVLEMLGITSAASEGLIEAFPLQARGVNVTKDLLTIEVSVHAPNMSFDYRLEEGVFKYERFTSFGRIVTDRYFATRLSDNWGCVSLYAVNLKKGSSEETFLDALDSYAIFTPDTKCFWLNSRIRNPVGTCGEGIFDACVGESEAILKQLGPIYTRRQWRSGEAKMTDLMKLFVRVLLIHPNSPALFSLDDLDTHLDDDHVRDMIMMIDSINQRTKKQVFITIKRDVFADETLPSSIKLFKTTRINQRTIIEQ